MKNWLIAMALVAIIGMETFGEDCFQWRGSERDGVYKETGLLKSWPEGGPKLLWSSDGIGNGYSSPVVVDGKIYVTGKNKKHEILTAFDLEGKQLWQVQYGNVWSGSYPDARTTPTVIENEIYVISGAGEVVCLNVIDGKIKWSVNARENFQGKTGRWGTAESPLVVDNKVIYTPCGEQTTMIALNRKDGSLVWKSTSLQDISGYVSPLLITHNGKRQILTVTGTYILGLDVQNGQIVWKVDYDANGSEKSGRGRKNNTNTPIFKDGYVFVTSGYDHGGLMLELAKDASSAKIIWKTDVLDTHHGGVVLVDGYIYGSNWLNNSKGNWVCLDWKSGTPQYETFWNSKGSIISAEGMLYCYTENGYLGLVPATPEGFKIKSSFRISGGSGQHWCHPSISNGRLYLRRGQALMVYDISAK